MTATLPPQLARLIRQDVQGMHAYAVQPSAGLVKLDAMENPHRLPANLQQALGARLGAVALNRYPGERVDTLRAALKAYAQVPDGYDLMLGNGSDELISLLAMACDVPGASILAPLPGFVMYGMSAQLQGLKFVGVDLTPDFELDESAMLEAIATHQPSIIYLAYPNNPTANLWDDGVIERIVEAAPGLVVMDEAYQPFASRSYLDRLTRHPHVLLMRTLSKFGLAGVRLGYMVGPAALIAQVDKVRPPYNVSVLNCEAALFALEHADVFHQQAAELRRERALLLDRLDAMPGVRAWRSDANMILVRVPEAARSFEGMKARGVLVKNVSRMHPLLANCLRLTVGTTDENAQMLAALQASL
ncbi:MULTISPECIES: histidinol-phosphate transaminase [Ramlibacter]|uniref:Histidinol-phosphate aminotransferase n=1 Tax=Ramlibacter pinisoli TaxID=2682844 RepID=A0A6N8J0E1_9BURK|nr:MULTISPECIES: histidinol-phosphate transaminase [Ramlibacter]MBA2962556.1 histidinol-phosphate transaminase [Ramlibacter sp. CGMCC 1.13660]MVQ32498.1 histidinol-phosphate transaminase [Ramlibacter pinisoli]